MYTPSQQFAEFNKANIAQATRIAAIAIENTEKLLKLNLSAAKLAFAQGVESASAVAAVKGDIASKPALYKALETQVIDSPRGKWTMSKNHNPIQDIYLRRVENKDNKVIGIAAKALADSGEGCKLG